MTDPISGDGVAIAIPASAPESSETPQATYNTKAVVGLILSIGSVVLVFVPVFTWLLAAPGIVLGVLGRNEIAADGGRGPEVAVAAIVIGAASAATSIAIIIGIGIAAAQMAHPLSPGGSSDACTSQTGDFTPKQLQACFDSQNP